MKRRALLIAGVAALLAINSGLALAHQGHEIDPELLAAKIRESGHPCASVTAAREKSERPTVLAVECGSDHHYRVVITSSEFRVAPSSSSPSQRGATPAP